MGSTMPEPLPLSFDGPAARRVGIAGYCCRVARHMLGLLALLPALALAALGPGNLLTAEEREWLRQNPVLRLAPDPNFPPIEYFDEQGRYRGLIADYYPLIEARLGVRFEVVRAATWDEVLDKARRREVDVLGAAQKTPAREQFLRFSQPIIDIPNVIVMRKEVAGTFDFDRLAGKKLAITRGNALDEYVRSRYPQIEIAAVADDLAGLQEVAFGRADATVVNLAIASYLIDRHGIANLRVAGDSGRSNALHIAVRSDWPLAAGILAKGLAAVTEEERDAIAKRWIKLGGRDIDPAVWIWTAWAGGLGALFLVGMLLINRSLQRQVDARTAALNEELSERLRIEVELRRAQGAMRDANALLETRVRERTEQLQAALGELEAFSYSASHDLRGPLRAFDGYSRMLEEDYGPQLDETARNYLQRMRNASHRMAELIDGLIDLARLTRSDLQRVPVDLSAIAEEIRHELEAGRHEGEQRSVSWRIEPGIAAVADVSAMHSVLGNLLRNAWKFTRNNPAAVIEFGTEKDGDHLVYFVRDNGVGFDMTYVDKLFKAFERLHRVADFEGTGIGLAAVQRLVARHSGRVWAEGKPGEGAVFRFTLGDTIL